MLGLHPFKVQRCKGHATQKHIDEGIAKLRGKQINDRAAELILNTSLKKLLGPYQPQKGANRGPRGSLELPEVGPFSLRFQLYLAIPGVPWAP